MAADKIDTIVSLSKRRGFVFPCSEIYGGQKAAWDYGPLGVELKENIKRQWWRYMVTSREDVVGIDSSVILAPEVWVASGHVATFSDPLTECTSCHKRFRADHLEEAYEAKKGRLPENGLADVNCPNCGTKGQFTEPKQFSGLLSTHLGPTQDTGSVAYLRPETAQGIFTNFAQVQTTSRRKPRSASPRWASPSATRSRPATSSSAPASSSRWRWSSSSSRARTRSGRSTGCRSGGTGTPAWACARRTCAGTTTRPRSSPTTPSAPPTSSTASSSAATSGVSWRASPTAPTTTSPPTPRPPARTCRTTTRNRASGTRRSSSSRMAGVGRTMLAFLLDAYTEDEAPNAKGKLEKRTVLRLDHRIAPVKVAVLPLSRNPELSPKAKGLATALRQNWNIDFDDAGAIGRRYRRQDEIGTPYCVTVDFDTLDDNAVTVRERDSMKQERVSLDQIEGYLAGRLVGA